MKNLLVGLSVRLCFWVSERLLLSLPTHSVTNPYSFQIFFQWNLVSQTGDRFHIWNLPPFSSCFIPADYLPRRHSLPHVTSVTPGRFFSGDEYSAAHSGFVCVESLIQSEKDCFTTRKSITACRRSSMPLTPTAPGTCEFRSTGISVWMIFGHDALAVAACWFV